MSLRRYRSTSRDISSGLLLFCSHCSRVFYIKTSVSRIIYVSSRMVTSRLLSFRVGNLAGVGFITPAHTAVLVLIACWCIPNCTLHQVSKCRIHLRRPITYFQSSEREAGLNFRGIRFYCSRQAPYQPPTTILVEPLPLHP